MSSLLSTLIERKEYFLSLKDFDNIPGTHNSLKERRKDLGYYMMKLKESHHNSEDEQKYLKKVHDELELNDLDDFELQYDTYLRLLAERDDRIEASNIKCGYFKGLEPIEPLKRSLWNHWGSFKQIKCGKCITDALNIHHN